MRDGAHDIADSALAIEATGLTLSYPRATRPALEGVSLSLAQGSLCALVGPNGAGKSTLVKVLMGIERPQQGSVRFLGLESGLARRRWLVGYVPQRDVEDAGFPLCVRDVAMMGRFGHLSPLGGPDGADRVAVEEALRRVGLWELRDRPISALSGGQSKRMFVARALAQRARVLLMDEPFAGVDKRSEALLLSLLREMSQEGVTLLVAVHDLRMAKASFEQAILLNREVVFQGPSLEAFDPAWLSRAFGVGGHAASELVA